MPEKYIERVFDVAIPRDVANPKEKDKEAIVRRLKPSEALSDQERSLRCFVGLLGEVEPDVLPLSASYGLDSESR